MLVKERMSRPVITVHPEMPVQEALNLMREERVRRFPVVDRHGRMVGIVSDLFKIFLELLGAREPGVRLAMLVPNIPGELARLTKAIYEVGGNILALGTFLGESSQNREVTIKVDGVEKEILIAAVQPYLERIVDIRGNLRIPRVPELSGPA